MNIKRFFLIWLLLFPLIFPSCKKKDDPSPEAQLAKLPAETQTGARTFGCLVNGKAFVNSGSMFAGSNLTVSYVGTNDGLSFNLSGSQNDDKKNGIPSITIGTEALAIQEGGTYPLKARAKGNAFGFYTFGDMQYETTTNVGEFHLTRFDPLKGIVSGTFWFDAVSEPGAKVEIRKGRFDMHF